MSLTPAVGSSATAKDLGPTSQELRVEWVSGGTSARTWALGALTLGALRNTVDDALALDIRNAGNNSVQVLMKVSTSSSGWTPGTTSDPNVFLMESDTAPAPQNDPSGYDLTLTASDQQFLPLLRSGLTSDVDLLFRAPQALTIGGGVAQSITVTITVQLPP